MQFIYPLQYNLCPDIPSKLYLDIEFCKENNVYMDGSEMINTLIEVFILNCNLTFGMNISPTDVVIMISSNILKSSYHIIFKTVVFENNIKCKSFVQYVMDNLSSENRERFTAFDKKMNRKSVVDLSVYSKNQNFRLLLSSKFGKNTALKFDEKHKNNAPHFFDTLICDHLLVVNTSDHSSETINVLIDKNEHIIDSEWPNIDKLVRSQLGTNGQISKIIRFDNKHNSSKLILLYKVRNYRYCDNVKRSHSSNTIYYIADTQRMCIYQKCNKCKTFRGEDKYV